MSGPRSFAAVLLALAGLAAPAHAQGAIAARVAAAPKSGAVAMHFPAREGVCGDGRTFITLGRMTMAEGGMYTDARGWKGSPCLPGPVRVVLTLHEGRVENVATTVGGATAPAGATDLGEVDPADAARYLLDLAARGEGRAADRAVLPAVLADRAVVWPSLLAIARDSARSRHHPARNSAAFWLSRFAAAARNGHPGELAAAEPEGDEEGDGESDVRGKAIFALSQLHDHEGVPPLIEVARDHRDPRARAQAMFWLGQSGDRRAYEFFEQVLKGGR